MDLVFRTVAIFLFILFVTRITGRRELNSLEPYDIIVLVVLGDLVQQGVTQSDNSVTGALIVISTIMVLSVLTGWIGFRFRKAREVIEGEPIIVVDDGRPIMRNLRRERITVEEVEAEARIQQLGSLEDVRWAVLETDGQISFVPKSM
jgi:uncharacterized membrane protein YcaP (DUF421 family)